MTQSRTTLPQSGPSRAVGRKAFAAISSVEGLHLSVESRDRLDALESSAMSFEEKRAAVVLAYLDSAPAHDA